MLNGMFLNRITAIIIIISCNNITLENTLSLFILIFFSPFYITGGPLTFRFLTAYQMPSVYRLSGANMMGKREEYFAF